MNACIVAFAVPLFAPIPTSDIVKMDKAMLQGTWKLETVEIDGKARTPNEVGGYVYISLTGDVICREKNNDFHHIFGVGIDKSLLFSGNKCTGECTLDGQDISDESAYTLSVSKDTRRISFSSDKSSLMSLFEPSYIYSVTKDELRLCFRVGAHPTNFETKKNKKICLLIYKREENGKRENAKGKAKGRK